MSQRDEEATAATATTPKKTTTAPPATATAAPPSPSAVTKALDAELDKQAGAGGGTAATADYPRISVKQKPPPPPPHSEKGSSSSNNNSTSTSTANNLPRLDCVQQWSPDDVVSWAKNYTAISESAVQALNAEQIDGEVLLILSEDDVRDFRYRLNYKLNLSEMKKLWVSIRALQQQQQLRKQYIAAPMQPRRNGSGAMYSITSTATATATTSGEPPPQEARACGCVLMEHQHYHHCDTESPPMSVDGRATNIPPEFFKTTMSVGYSFLVTWITSFVMVIVHERVPDMKRYPPLPDIFLDNVPHIPWAFHMCEITGTLLFLIWLSVIIFHKYRMVLLRRFFALAGTVFLLRCVTMLITSLSVPGTHLQCNQADYAVDDSVLTLTEALGLRISRAYIIWSGLGMSIQGVRTCGDYMFSGHTVALTLLNFFITEYTPRNLYFLHTLTWLMNMFGIFFILAAHEHYSIDVFVAFYITSRLFLYYHTLANNQALMSHDSNRTRIWFPMFSYFESSIDGIIPNEYDTPASLMESLFQMVLYIKDLFMLTARRIAIQNPRLTLSSKNVRYAPSTTSTVTSMHSIPPTPRTPSAETLAEYQSCSNATTVTLQSSLAQAASSETPAEATLNRDTNNQLSAREKVD